MVDWRKLFEETAEIITGRRILLRFRNPPSANANGEVYRPEDAPSLCLIDIQPGLNLESQYMVLLHEIGHILSGHIDKVAPTKITDEQSGAIEAVIDDNDLISRIVERREDEARAEAGILDNWANEKTKKFIQPGDPIEQQVILKLTALKFWKG